MQALTGVVNSFSHFIFTAHWPRNWRSAVYAGGGKNPLPTGTYKKSAAPRSAFLTRQRYLAGAIAPPALVLMQIARGWRTMFVVIGLAGIVVGLCWYAWYRNRAQFDLQQEERQYLAAPEKARPTLVFSEWLALFKRRTTRGMIFRLLRG